MPLDDLLSKALAAPAAAEDTPHVTEQRILDAALDEVAEQGPQRTTVDDIARRGSVGRMTIFRRFRSKDELLQRLAVRELRRFLDEVDAALGPDVPVEDRVVESFVLCFREGRRHPLLVRLAPGTILEQLATGDPPPVEIARSFVAERLDHPEASELADVLVRLALTYALLPGAFAGEEEARAFARRRLLGLL